MTETIQPDQQNQMPLYIRLLSKFLLRLWGWKVVGDFRKYPKGIFITQHTSNWDGVLTLAAAYSVGIRPRWIGKQGLFKGGKRKFMEAIGGIEISRGHLGTFADDVIEVLEQEEVVWIYIAPEGTRKKVKYWREGFYLVADRANLPIIQGYLNYQTKEVGIGQSMMPSGDIHTDIKIIRKWFEDAHPKYPEKAGDIQVKLRKNRLKNASE